MLLSLTIVFIIMTIVLLYITRNNPGYGWEDAVHFISAALCILSFLALAIMGVIGFVNHIGIEGKIAAYDARYKSLVYQFENDIYENDNDLGKRELMEDIEYWNADLARRKANQDDPWIGVFIPDIYDEFEFIEFEE